jgi:pilus assembly protein Flp/PilA
VNHNYAHPFPSLNHRSRGKQEGQGLVEYALILAIASVMVVVVLSVMGSSISDIFGEVSCTLQRGSADRQVNSSVREHYGSDAFHWASVWDEISWNRLMEKTNVHYKYHDNGCYVYIVADQDLLFVESDAETNLSAIP